MAKLSGKKVKRISALSSKIEQHLSWNASFGKEQKLLEAVTQLLGYLTWKDSKTALIVFDKDVAGFTKIQEKIPEVLKQHPNFVRDGKAQDSGEWHMTFHSTDDPDRLVTIHVFLFNLFLNK